MASRFEVGDHVTWRAEAGEGSGIVAKIHVRDFDYKGHAHHACSDDPRYEIRSDNTGHVAVHQGGALNKSSRQA